MYEELGEAKKREARVMSFVSAPIRFRGVKNEYWSIKFLAAPFQNLLEIYG